jgi:tetratricopeptide (TPR) repeat protein
MNLGKLGFALGLVAIFWSPAAWSKPQPPLDVTIAQATQPPPPSTQPPPQTRAQATTTTVAAQPPLQAPRDVRVDASTPDSEALATRAATAEIAGNPQAALAYAARAIEADPRDPWGHYDKAAALARLGNIDDALKSFAASEERFNVADVWGRSVAIYGGAHALAGAGRCEEAKREFLRYAAFVRERDPRSADLAVRYAADCHGPAVVPATPTAPPAPSPTP